MSIYISSGHKIQTFDTRSICHSAPASLALLKTWVQDASKAVRIKIYHIHQLAVITTSRTGLIQQIHHLVRSNQIPANIINDCYYGTVEDINVMNAIHTA